MNDRDDPTRWAHGAPDAPSEFAELLRADDRAAPSAPQLVRMLDGLAAQLAVPELASQARPAPAATAAAAHKAVLPLIFGALALLGVAGAVMLLRAPADPAQPAPPARASARANVGAPPAPVLVPQAATRPATRLPAAEVTPTAVPAARASAARNARAGAGAQAGRAPAVREDEREDPVAELALLERAQRVLRSEPAAALALAQEHRARFERGALAQEREMLAIEALLRLQRRAQAERRARAFEQRYPQSSHGPRLRDLLRSGP